MVSGHVWLKFGLPRYYVCPIYMNILISGTKPYAAFSPTPMMISLIKFSCDRSAGLRDFDV